MQVTGGDTSVVAYFMVRLAADGTAATGIAATAFDLQYTRTLTAADTKDDGIVGTGGATTWVEFKVFEINSTSSPGLYMACFSDAAFAAGVPEVHLALTSATTFAEVIKCQIDTPVILANNALHGGAAAVITFEKVVGLATGNDDCVELTGKGTGSGLNCVGGDASGHGLNCDGGAPNGVGISAVGDGSGSGMNILSEPVAGTGDGLTVEGGGTSGDALALAVTSGVLIETGAIVAGTFAAGAINAAAIATDAITAAKIAANAITLADGPHGGSAAVFTFDRMIGAATTGDCVKLTGFGSADGLNITGGATNGDAVTLTGGATNGRAVRMTGAGTGTALSVASVSGNAVDLTVATQGNGLAIIGGGTGLGVGINGGSTGHGVQITGGATSGDAVALLATIAGDPPNQLTPGVPYGSVTDAGASATAFDTDLQEAVTDFWKDGIVVFLTGNLEGSHGRITASSTIGGLTIQTGDLTAAPDNGSKFMVIGRATA